MSQKPLIARTLLLLLAATFLLSGAAFAENNVRLECPAAMATLVVGDSVSIPVHITNDVDLSGFSLGFTYNSDQVEIMSIDLNGSIIPAATLAFVQKKYVPAANQVLVGWADYSASFPIVPQTDGVLFTLHMKVLDGMTPGCVDIDSTFVPPAGPFVFAPSVGSKIYPTYSDCGTGDVMIGVTECVAANNPPVAQCQNVIVDADSTCHAAASVDNGSFDPDAGQNITLAQVPPGPYPVGVTNVMLIVTDNGTPALADTCNATVTVNDVTKPQIVCPGDIVQGSDVNQCGAIVDFAVTATDNCTANPTIVVNPPSGSLFPVGMTNVMAIATDASGNADTCNFHVTVNDTQAPVANCPGDMVVDNDVDSCGAIVTFEYSVNDNCPGASVTATPESGTMFPVGVTQVVVAAIDGAGLVDTCRFNVTVNDTQKPVVLCPGNLDVTANPGDTGKVVEFQTSATDNCPDVNVVADPASGSFFPLGMTTVTVVATDAHGLADTCSFTVNVQVGANPDFAVDATPDTIMTTEGISDSLLFNVDLTSIDGYNGNVGLAVTGVPTGTVLDFGTTPISVPGSTTLGGHTGANTPAGTYELTIQATEIPNKLMHSTTVYLVVNPCLETPVPMVSQSQFDLQITEGENPSDEQVYITNDATCGTLGWTATSDQPWVFADPSTGTVNAGETPGSLTTLKFNTSGLTPDTYVAHVLVDQTAPPPDKSGKVAGAEITINLTVNPKPPSEDSVVVDNATVFSGQQVGVPVRFFNTEELAGMSAGLHWNSSNVTLDSVSFVGSRVDYINAKFATINQGNMTVALGVLRVPPEPVVVPGDGLWATLWFTGGQECPMDVMIDSQFIAPGVEVLFNDSLANSIYPQFAPGTLHVDCAPTFCVSGTIMDGSQNPIVGAIVELYDTDPPSGNPIATGTSGIDGSYELCPITKTVQYTVRAYKPGYYAKYVQATLPETNLELTLMPVAGVVMPTWEWVNLYCDQDALFEDQPLLPGSVVEAYDPTGVLCGRFTVTQPGTYGFMPVYRDDPYSPGVDEGCDPNDMITLKVNGYPVTMANGPIYWGSNGDRYEACFNVHVTPPSHCIILKQGWNLVSWNIDTPNDSIQVLAQDVMDNVDVILGFEAGAMTYDPMLPDFSTLEFADHYHGYWFRMNAEDTLCVEGPMVAASTPIDLEQNWNLVSYLPLVPYTVPVALNSIWQSVVVVLGYDNGALTYDPANPGLATLTQMQRDFGYWIKTTQAGTLMYPEPGPMFAKAAVNGNPSTLTPNVAESNSWINLYGSNVMLNGAPLPVGTTIEAYDATGNLVGDCLVRTTGKFGFMPVYGSETFDGNVVGKSAGSTITLKVNGDLADQQVTWTSNGDRIRISELTTAKGSSNLPNSFTLKQNYPNPFNPETTIDYVVAKSGHVELAVYNILGNKIKTLVSGYQAAGNYSVRWQADSDGGTSVASGVYFYKLTAGDYTDTKKMTLLK